MSILTQIPPVEENTVLEKEDHGLRSLSRRQMLKIGAASIAAFIVSGGIQTRLKIDKPKALAKNRLPQKNPAFSNQTEKNGFMLCQTHDKATGGRTMYRLNRVGAEIYLACDGQHNASQIAEIVASKFHLNSGALARDAAEYLAVLEKYNLVVTDQKMDYFYRTMERHERT